MYFGAHVKASGGVWTAVERGEALGVQAIQFFAGSPRTWKPQLYRSADAERFREARAASGLRFAVIHTIYLINLATVNEEFYERSSSLSSARSRPPSSSASKRSSPTSAPTRAPASRPAWRACVRPFCAPWKRSATRGCGCCSRTPRSRRHDGRDVRRARRDDRRDRR